MASDRETVQPDARLGPAMPSLLRLVMDSGNVEATCLSSALRLDLAKRLQRLASGAPVSGREPGTRPH